MILEEIRKQFEFQSVDNVILSRQVLYDMYFGKLLAIANAASEFFKPHEKLESKYEKERILYEALLELEKEEC